jgi:hypothetical protein
MTAVWTPGSVAFVAAVESIAFMIGRSDRWVLRIPNHERSVSSVGRSGVTGLPSADGF